MEEYKYSIAAVGDNCIDYYTESDQSFPGGNSVNVAVYTERLGEKASYIGAVGNDSNGRGIVDALANKGVDTSHIHILEGATAVTEVSIIRGDRKFGDYREGVLAEFRLSKEDIDFAGRHDLIVSGIWGMIENDLPQLKDTGKPIAFDFSDQFDHPLVSKITPYVDYAFFAAEDEDEAELVEKMKGYYNQGPKIVIVTRGKNGSMAYDGQQIFRCGIVKCDVVDTMGAGDSFIAGFLTALLRGKAIDVCMCSGAENSSITIQYFGAW
jgi:fructoselysine 6-kinase